MTKTDAKKNKLLKEMFDDALKFQKHIVTSVPKLPLLKGMADFLVLLDQAIRKAFHIRLT